MMKRILLIALIFTSFSTLAQTQEIGLRFGDVTGGNIAIDGIFSYAEYSRIHADLSFGNGIAVDAIWDFTYRPLGDGNIYYYAGVGGSVYLSNPLKIGIPAELGLQYTFSEYPFSISIDWRPWLQIIDTTDLYFGGFGLNIRYTL